MKSNKPNYYKHAVRCGVDMHGKTAVHVRRSVGRLTAVDIAHPETCQTVISAGCRLDHNASRWLRWAGMDYVIVEK